MQTLGVKCLGGEWLRCGRCHHAQLNVSEKAIAQWHQTCDTKRVWKPLYDDIRERRLDVLGDLAPRAGSVLDIGCGRGTLLGLLRWIPRKVGIDPDATAAGYWSEPEDVEYIQTGLSEYAKKDQQFDLVMAWHVFEHVRDIRQALAQALKLTAPKGYLIGEVPIGIRLRVKNYDGHAHRFSPASVLHWLAVHGASLVRGGPGMLEPSFMFVLQKD